MRNDKTIIPNVENLPIKEYWDKLPKRTKARDMLLGKLSKKTGREANSVRRWFLNISEPPTPRIKQIVADTLSCEIEVLFPTKSE